MHAVYNAPENYEIDQGDDQENERELCLQMAVKVAMNLPTDPKLAGSIMEMVSTIHAALTDLRQRPLAG